jgi:AAA+ ATPase superfamily predicted ATPase
MDFEVNMPRSPFIARERELNLLQNQWQSPQARLMILYGRRRVGKTRLVTHWLEQSGVRALYWVGAPTSPRDQLASFSQALYNFEGPGTAPDNFTYASWEQAFQQIARLAREQRTVVILDEFTYLLAVEPGIAGVLQNIWDQLLSQSNLFLIISGSHIGMMQRHLLSYQAPLYGRATSKLQLLPLPFATTRHFFPNYRPDERVAVYAIMGGVPAYWEQFDSSQSLDANIREQFLGGANLMQDEPRLLLQDFLSEIHNYVAILRAIANGRRTPKEISSTAGLADKHIGMYLNNLVHTGFVERRVPVTENETSRLGRHFITDPFLRFYYRFLSRHQDQLAVGVQDQVLEELKRHLVDFIGTYTWEELCREWLLRASGHDRLPFLPDQVGSIWNRQAQVDVVGYNSMEKTLILGECKWNRHPIDWDILSDLVEKTSKVIPAEGNWKVYYLGFARQGWTDAAQQFAVQFASQAASGKQKGENWRAVGMQLLDLNQVDEDLAGWTV